MVNKRVMTQTMNALKRNGVKDPYALSIGELLRIRGIGARGVAWLAEVGYPTPPNYIIEELNQ